MRKPIVFILLVGMGYLLAITPSVWKLVVYSMPIFSLCILIAAIRVWLKGKPDD